MTESEKQHLLDLARNGDVAAFEKLVSLTEDKIFSFALSITRGDHATASDIYQEAVLKAFLCIRTFQGKASFSSWLWKIMRNEFINYSKGAKTRNSDIHLEDLPGFEISDERNSEEEIVRDEASENLRKLISELHINYQEIITLIDFEGMTYEETADLLNISVDSVKVRVHRAREKLTKLVMDHEELF